VYRTRNGARSWRAVETGLEDPAIQCLLISRSFVDDHLVVAGTEADGLLRSTDGGNTWHSPPSLSTGGVTALAQGHGIIVAATENGVAVSKDFGHTWHAAEGGPRQPALSLLFRGHTLLAGLHRTGVVRSTDDGTTWQPVNDGLSARLETELTVSGDNAVCIGGPENGIRVSRDGGATWVSGRVESGVYSIAASGDHLWAASSTGLRVSRDGGLVWDQSTFDSQAARIVAAGCGTVLAAVESGVLVLSRDDGATWRELQVPSEKANIAALSVLRDRTFLVATAAAEEVTLWHWEDLRGWSRLLVERATGILRVALAASAGAQVDRGIFIGLGPRVLHPLRDAQEVRRRERRPIWRATDLGPRVSNVTSLATVPGGRIVLAGTNTGVFASHDAGETFHEWSDGTNNPRVVAVTVAPDRTAYALGLGGSLWRRSF
jgi:photosystem II stability/assembly factor-like uncharacterized protein